jgi:hypothetical protein
MQMRLLIGAYLVVASPANSTISKGSKPRHYIFMWIVGVLKVEIRPVP